MKNELKYVQKFNPDFSTFAGGTIKQNKGKFTVNKSIGANIPKNNVAVYQDSRRFIKQYDKPLKDKYFEKLGYIKSPLNQVNVPEISLSKRSF